VCLQTRIARVATCGARAHVCSLPLSSSMFLTLHVRMSSLHSLTHARTRPFTHVCVKYVGRRLLSPCARISSHDLSLIHSLIHSLSLARSPTHLSHSPTQSPTYNSTHSNTTRPTRLRLTSAPFDCHQAHPAFQRGLGSTHRRRHRRHKAARVIVILRTGWSSPASNATMKPPTRGT
jgi:hypothetical protein